MKSWYEVLAAIFLQPEYCVDVVHYFRRELLCILHVAIDVGKSGGRKVHGDEHVRNCVILAKIVQLHPDVKRYVVFFLVCGN